MKIIFEFYGEPQVSFTGAPYDSSGQKPPRWMGMRVDGLICDGPSSLRPDGDTLYIEGDLASVRKICEQVLEQLEFAERFARANVEAKIARSKQCPTCSMWFDPKNGVEHGDGRGMSCLGDGTVLMGNRLIIAQWEHGPVETNVETLSKGERFTIKEPIDDYEKREFVALEDAFILHGCGHVRVQR